MRKAKKILSTFLISLGATIGLLLIATLILSRAPSLAANGANTLRGIIGVKPVSFLESVLFTSEDLLKQALYHTGIQKAEAPWQAPAMKDPQVNTTTLSPSQPGIVEALPSQKPGTPSISTPGPAWSLPAIPSSGSLPGEGVWSPYLFDSSGSPIALRTFLQPDSKRPYAILSIVAFDLTRTQLHFVLGSIEPKTSTLRLSGEIPAQDLVPGRLVAAFNGGFMAVHGEYGAMANGITALPPKDKLATIGFYPDGTIRIGKWGVDISPNDPMTAWRQNGPLILYNGQVTPAVSNNTTALWGGTVEGHVATWRSGVALNQANTILYYFAGPAMDVGTMAKALVKVGAYQAMQLDINNFWVHFAAIRAENGQLKAESLVNAMSEKVDRYLKAYPRDFFYVTAR
jgi:hypothetical protein